MKQKTAFWVLMFILFMALLSGLFGCKKVMPDTKPEFEAVIPSHLLSIDILDWARKGYLPDNAIDQFIESRVDNILSDLKTKLQGITFDVIDTIEITVPVTTTQNTL